MFLERLPAVAIACIRPAVLFAFRRIIRRFSAAFLPQHGRHDTDAYGPHGPCSAFGIR